MEGHMIAFRAALTRKGELEARKEYVRARPVRFVPIDAGQFIGKYGEPHFASPNGKRLRSGSEG